MPFIPEPYAHYEVAWRMAYLSIFGAPLSDDEYKKSVKLYENERAKEASQPRRRFPAVDSGGPDFINLRALGKQSLPKPAPLSDPFDVVAALFRSGYKIPKVRVYATRNLLLQKLFDKEIVGYWLEDGPTAISDNKFWTSERGPAALINGTVVFHRDELKKAFPPKNAMSQGQRKRGPGQPKKVDLVVALIDKVLGDGWEDRMRVNEGLYIVQDAAPDDLDVKETTFNSARKLIADRD